LPLPKSCSRCGRRIVSGLAASGFALLVACSPVETYRALTGANKNDPDPETALNSRNLAAAENAGYPNLATVPAPPTGAMSGAERQRLTETLVADAGEVKSAAGQDAPSGRVASAPVPPPPRPPPPPLPASGVVADAASASAAPQTAGGDSATSAAQHPPGAPGGARPIRRKQGEPPEPGPTESSLQMPEIRAIPAPEKVRAPPPAPHLAATPAPPAASLPPAAVSSAAPQAAPPVPTVPPPPPPVVAAGREQREAPPARASTLVVAVDPDDSSAAAIPDRQALDQVLAAYKQEPGVIRVRVYAGVAAAGAGAAQLGSFHAALERAQTIVAALVEAGIPKDKVQAEAAPAGAALPVGRIELRIER